MQLVMSFKTAYVTNKITVKCIHTQMLYMLISDSRHLKESGAYTTYWSTWQFINQMPDKKLLILRFQGKMF